MKKMLEKHGKVRCVGAGLGILGLLLFIIAAFLKNAEVVMQIDIVGLVLTLIGGFMFAFEAKEHRLLKLISVFVVCAFLFTWVFPYGYFQGLDFYNYEMQRLGLSDLSMTVYTAVYYSLDKLVFLFIVAGFYGILAKTSGYQKLVSSIAKKLKKYEIPAAVVISLIIVALTSLLSQTLAVLIFIPFFVAILLGMKIDKLTTFAITFGSALIGVLGATYGTDSLAFFNKYLGTEISVGLTYRAIILLVAFVLYNFFICMRLKKVLKEKTKDENIEELAFYVEPTRAKTSIIPVSIVLAVVAIITILGYVNWTGFGIDVFTKFHTWLTELTIGEDFTIMAYILGTESPAFGTFDLMTMVMVLVIASALIAFLYRVKLADYFDAAYNGIKKMFKPVLCFVGVYLVFAVCSMSPFIPTITNWALNLVDGFNPYITSIVAFLTSTFHTDFGYTAYSVGSFLTTAYASDLSIVHTVYTSMYGLVQIIMPTGALLLVGLSLMKVDYKSWFKYIWLFVVGMFIILLVLFTVLTYV